MHKFDFLVVLHVWGWGDILYLTFWLWYTFTFYSQLFPFIFSSSLSLRVSIIFSLSSNL